jgi:hypothetical protein
VSAHDKEYDDVRALEVGPAMQLNVPDAWLPFTASFLDSKKDEFVLPKLFT